MNTKSSSQEYKNKYADLQGKFNVFRTDFNTKLADNTEKTNFVAEFAKDVKDKKKSMGIHQKIAKQFFNEYKAIKTSNDYLSLRLRIALEIFERYMPTFKDTGGHAQWIEKYPTVTAPLKQLLEKNISQKELLDAMKKFFDTLPRGTDYKRVPLAIVNITPAGSVYLIRRTGWTWHKGILGFSKTLPPARIVQQAIVLREIQERDQQLFEKALNNLKQKYTKKNIDLIRQELRESVTMKK